MRTTLAPLLLAGLLASGCDTEAPPAEEAATAAPTETTPALPDGHPALTPPGVLTAAAAADTTAGPSGVVKETMDSAGYTYALLESGERTVWIAGPQTALELGEAVEAVGGSLMADFASPSLGRTFEEIWFVASFGGEEAAAASPDSTLADPAASTSAEPVPHLDGGQTVAEVYGRAAELSGTEVALRGRVVKVNNAIMGKNWLHVVDGTGDAAAGTDDLVVTTQGDANVGDVVVVRGKVATDKDFGMGYFYAVLVEEAVISAE